MSTHHDVDPEVAPPAPRTLPRAPHLALLSPDEAPPASAGAGCWELDGVVGGDPARCAAFLHGLDGLTRADWLAIGRGCAASSPDVESAAAALAAELTARRLTVPAWYVHDAVQSVCATAFAREHASPSAAERTLLAGAHAAAARAALACLTHPWLARADYQTLLAPFPSLVREAAGG